MDLQTESELTQDINSITSYINTNFPELSSFIEEISTSYGFDSDHAVDAVQGQEYYDSLEILFKNYAISQVVI